ncbi:MAG: SMC-Scp complex subunit ScpB [Spartobacteria bacterium]|nr:SMC-Scp complex subunit ScpB [Spartobacteria bacterium]
MKENNNVLASPPAPSLKHIVGALLYASTEPLSISRILRIISEVQEDQLRAPEEAVTPAAVRHAVEEIKKELERGNTGMTLSDAAGGYRLHNERATAPWVRQLLERPKPRRLTKAALETLAVIAYRQPVTRADIESVRGVAVDALIKKLQEMNLIKTVGRSELPGHPAQFGTTKAFLEHFGLKDIADLPGRDDWRRWNQQLLDWKDG